MSHLVVKKSTTGSLTVGANCWPYLVVAGDALVHDVVEVHQKITVGEHILVPGHHLTDQLVGLQLSSLVLGGQHGSLRRGGRRSGQVSIIIRSLTCLLL